MDDDSRTDGADGAEGRVDALRREERELLERVARLRAEAAELGIEVEVRRATARMLGKGQGADPDNLTNRQKALLVDRVAEAAGRRPPELFAAVGIARSTYHYHKAALRRPGRDEGCASRCAASSRRATAATGTGASTRRSCGTA